MSQLPCFLNVAYKTHFFMKARLTSATELRGAVVQEDPHSDLISIMEEKFSLVLESYPEGSFA